MQNMSSKDELLLQASELFDGHCHQPSQVDKDLLASDEVKDHLNAWSLIGSALRNELPPKVDVNFAQNVMARLEEEESSLHQVESQAEACAEYHRVAFNLRKAHQEQERLKEIDLTDQCLYQDQTKIPQSKTVEEVKSFFNFKKLGVWGAQVAVAASVAVVAVVGLQTYNASDPSMMDPVSTASMNTTAISGVSLASYQNNSNDIVMNVGPQDFEKKPVEDGYQANIQAQKKNEIDRINLYVKGYMSDMTAKD